MLHRLDWARVGALLGKTAATWAIPGSLLTLALISLLALRWSIFLRRQAIAVPFSTVFSLTWSGQFFNSVLPGSTGGDFVKIYQLCRLAPERKAAAAVTVVMDRLTALVALLVLAGAAFTMQPVSWADFAGTSRPGTGILLMAGSLLAAAGVALALLMGRHWEVWKPRLCRVLFALKTSLTLSPELVVAVALSFAIHLLSFFIVYCLARSLGIAISYLQVLQFLPVLLFLVMLPVTVNGHGLREVLLIFYFTKLGITLPGSASRGVQETAVALSALLVANDLLWSLPGGLWYFFRFKRRLVAPRTPITPREEEQIRI